MLSAALKAAQLESHNEEADQDEVLSESREIPVPDRQTSAPSAPLSVKPDPVEDQPVLATEPLDSPQSAPDVFQLKDTEAGNEVRG